SQVTKCVRLVKSARDRVFDLDPQCTTVVASYVDWQRSESLPPEAIAAIVFEYDFKVLLVDTWKKDGQGLLAWLSLEAIQDLASRCREHAVRIALAGSLGRAEV